MITLDALRAQDGVRHAFFTRAGGVSGGIYAALNCGFGSADAPGHVTENRRRAMDAIELAPDRLATLHQVHSPTVVEVEEPWPRGGWPRADAMVTRRRGVALGILTADCAPVLLADERAGIVGAAHAGWRGALDGVCEATVDAMVALGGMRGRIVAGIGPCIGPGSYEVGPEFRARFLAADAAVADLFAPAAADGKWMFDLPAYVARRLGSAGIAAIDLSGRDTCAEPQAFFSHRRAVHRGENDYGRGLSAIALQA
ncbi:MAG: peptidoglycan editing factor PgeF [Alphaproteobacteria bacterium]